MRHTLLGLLGLTLVCFASDRGFAHEPAGREAVARPVVAHVSAPSAVRATLCESPADCSVESPPGVRRRQASPWYVPPREITAAVAAASIAKRVDFNFLLKTALLESSFDPVKDVKTSSAIGLYQFVEQTWLYLMRDLGPDFGLQEFSEAIVLGDDGTYDVTDAKMRAQILWLRYDAALAAMFAAELTRRNADVLSRGLGREVGPEELYLAHVMGAGGAAELIRLAEQSPGANACKEFARAARANRTIFYDGRKPRSVEAVYGVLTSKYFDIPVFAERPVPWFDAPEADWRNIPSPVQLLGDHDLIHAMR